MLLCPISFHSQKEYCNIQMQTISSFFIIIITIIIVVVTIINTPSHHTVTLLSSQYARFFLHYLVRHEIHNKIMHPPLGFAVFFLQQYFFFKKDLPIRAAAFAIVQTQQKITLFHRKPRYKNSQSSLKKHRMQQRSFFSIDVVWLATTDAVYLSRSFTVVQANLHIFPARLRSNVAVRLAELVRKRATEKNVCKSHCYGS